MAAAVSFGTRRGECVSAASSGGRIGRTQIVGRILVFQQKGEAKAGFSKRFGARAGPLFFWLLRGGALRAGSDIER
jgi:hypothetical protein